MSSSLSVCRELWRWCFPLFSFFCFFFFLSFSSFCLCLRSSSNFTYWSDMGIPGESQAAVRYRARGLSTATAPQECALLLLPATHSQADPHLCVLPHQLTQPPGTSFAVYSSSPETGQSSSLLPDSWIHYCITRSIQTLKF